MEITKETTMGEMIEFDRGIAYIPYGIRYALRWLPIINW